MLQTVTGWSPDRQIHAIPKPAHRCWKERISVT